MKDRERPNRNTTERSVKTVSTLQDWVSEMQTGLIPATLSDTQQKQ